MDMLPFIGTDREVYKAPTNFCDNACRDIYTKYKDMFLVGREDAERLQRLSGKDRDNELPFLDLSL